MTIVARVCAVLVLGALAACGPAPDPLTEDLPAMGAFRMGYNIVVADEVQQVPPSRNASEEELIAAVESEIARRFDGYQGERLYHFGVSVDGYALAPPGIPVVLNPRSVLVVTVNLWDDARGEKIGGPEQFLITEGSSGETLIGSGLTRTREEQLQVLARNAARRIQQWMLENPDWFDLDAVAAAEAEAALAELNAASEALEQELEAQTDEAPAAE